MDTIRAVLTDPNAVGRVGWGERAAPSLGPAETLIRVAAVSLNRGELNFAAAKPAGSPIGWDIAGTIEHAAPGGPAKGTRVVGFSRRQEGWGEVVSVPVDDVAPIPDVVTFEAAATLPVAAGTALACIDAAQRSLLGRRVLVTGVTGGVGSFAVQLALLCGAHVVAQVRKPEQVAYVEQLGAHGVLVTEDGAGISGEPPFDMVIDGVGGPVLQAALHNLDASGFAVNYGVTGAKEIGLALGPLLSKGRVTIRGLNLYAVSEEVAPRRWLARLVSLVAGGHLKITPARVENWSSIGTVAQALLDRKFYGKAVLTAS